MSKYRRMGVSGSMYCGMSAARVAHHARCAIIPDEQAWLYPKGSTYKYVVYKRLGYRALLFPNACQCSVTKGAKMTRIISYHRADYSSEQARDITGSR